MARPSKYIDDSDKPVSVSLRIPRDVYDQAQHHARMRQATFTQFVVEALRLRLDTPLDPRDIVASQDITVMQELEQLIDTRIKVILAEQTSLSPAPARVPLETPSVTLPQDRNTVLQTHVSAPSGSRKPGRPGTMRQRILDLLGAHPEGLSAEQIRVHLDTTQPLGDTLQGMRRQHVVRTEGTGHTMRYFAGS